MSAEPQGFRGRADTTGPDVITVFLDQAEQEWGMGRVMRHTHEIGLRQVVHFALSQQVEQFGHLYEDTPRPERALMRAFEAAAAHTGFAVADLALRTFAGTGIGGLQPPRGRAISRSHGDNRR